MPDETRGTRWQQVREDDWMALHQVAREAREAVRVAAIAGVHLGPLRAALDNTTYRVDPMDVLPYLAPSRED